MLRLWRQYTASPLKRFILHFNAMTGTQFELSNNSRSDHEITVNAN